MSSTITRRKFFRKAGGTLMAGGAMAYGSGVGEARSKKRPAPVKGVDYYSKLGVTPFINAAGTFTVLSASILPDEVQAAMNLAAQQPVNIEELHKAAGEYLAKQLKCEAALVTAGAASALTLGTAACISMGNQQAIGNLPADMTGLKNEAIVQKTHRYEYDHALRNCGIKFVNVETLADYEAAFNENTVMAHFFNAAESGQISREDWVRVAHKHNVPCFNDAAADVPPISNLWNYTQMGFDLVTFSGGKGIRGPQCTGLLLGRKDLIGYAVKNNNPYGNTVGRGMKVGKEEIVGMVAAVDWFLSQDETAMIAEFQRRAERVAAQVKNIPTVETKIFIPPVANHVPHLQVSFDQNRIGMSGRQIMDQMRKGSPRIELNPAVGPNFVTVGVWMLKPDEDVIVARRLRELFQGAIQS
jgi:L-seryl-tRNA(Ser) seleniumtransferase